MDRWDDAGIAAASAAVALAVAVWAVPSAMTTAESALERASLQVLEGHGTGQPLLWRDADSGRAATILPAAAYRAGDGRMCRRFSVTRATDGASTSHVACRDHAGRWSHPVPAGEQMAGF